MSLLLTNKQKVVRIFQFIAVVFKFLFNLGVLDTENVKKKLDANDLRALWKKAINQQVLLIRMEKENAKLKGW